MTTDPQDVPKTLASVELADHRRLSWHEFGDRGGRPCVFLPGAGTSGLAGAALHTAAAAHNIRLISIDRPGLGLSDPAIPRTLVDWATDIEQLADHENLEHFTQLGHSAGGAYALAVTRRLTTRVQHTVIGAGSAPYSETWTRDREIVPGGTRLYFNMAVRAPKLFSALHLLGTPRTSKAIDRLLNAVSRGKSPDASFAGAHPEQTRISFAALADGCRQGGAGPTEDLAALTRPWGFDLTEVTGPVDWWHGEHDTNVTARSGREITSRLPNATAHFVDGGHYIVFSHADEIMAAFAAAN